MKDIPRRLKDAAEALVNSPSLANDGFCALRLFKQLLYASTGGGDAPRRAVAQTESVDKPRRIGIWEPELVGSDYRFVRAAEPAEPSTLWANVRAIEPKGQRTRIVLLGESVGRGFFFDPHFNPAKVLQNTLREISGDRQVEVVDLARTDLLLEPLQKLAEAAVQLKPDALVVLAGNNWQPLSNLSRAEFDDLAATLRAGTWIDVKHFLEALLRERVLSALETLCRLAEANRFRLIFVLPEFNLVDWRTEASEPPLLSCSSTTEWHSLREAAERAFAAGDLKEAQSLSQRLLALDGGTTAAGSNILADCKLRTGATAEARQHLEASRDSAICWPRGPESPRCYSTIQKAVREESTKNRFTLVDLPRVFQDYSHNGLPDRRTFMDYCHFTVEGTHIAMSAVAQVVLASVFNLRRPIRDIYRIKLPVDAKVEGEAHFLAAIHNGNWGQQPEIVRYHCTRAVELSPPIQRIMTLFLDFHVRRIPLSLSKSFDELCQVENTSVVSLLFDRTNPVADKFLNRTLIEEIVTANEKNNPALRSKTDDLLGQQHGVDQLPVDLLNKAYSASSYHSLPDESDVAYLRCCHRQSVFNLRCSRLHPIELTLSYRTRDTTAGQPIGVKVNGREVATIPSSVSWTSATLVVPATHFCCGFNTVQLDWPNADWNLRLWKDRIADRLETGSIAALLPTYGELHAFQASNAGTRAEVASNG
jgi:hypothetical protein